MTQSDQTPSADTPAPEAREEEPRKQAAPAGQGPRGPNQRGPGQGPAGQGGQRKAGPGQGKGQGRRGPGAAARKPDPIPVPPPVARASVRGRHWLSVFSFILLVGLPIALCAWYLWERAADQYASYVGFSVRTEDTSSAIELLGGITELSGSSSSDTDILHKFLESQRLVRTVDAELDLRAMWSKADPDVDPIFAYHTPGTIEDLSDYWARMVNVQYDASSGLLDLRINAFTAEDAQAIAQAIFRESSEMINALSSIAREDTLRYTREELEGSVERLKEARAAMTTFRNENQIVDPEANIQSQVGLLGSLQAQLAEALIEVDLLSGSSNSSDPRIIQQQRRVDVIRARIDAEQGKLGGVAGDEGTGDVVFADILSEYESLAVDRQFAEEAYRSSLAAFDSAQAEARRQSRYLAAHVEPTLAESAQYPQRAMLLGLVSLFLFLTWSSLSLVLYALKDRR